MALLAAGLWALRDVPAPQDAAATNAAVAPQGFLGDLPLDESGYALLLHDQVTGDGLRVVRGAEALKDAQALPIDADGPDAPLQETLMSAASLVDRETAPTTAFVSVLKDKAVTASFSCRRQACGGDDWPFKADLSALVAASEPVTLVTESFDHHDKARAEMWRLLQDPDVALIAPPDLPPPGTIVFPARVRVSLPAVLLETGEGGVTPAEPFDEAALAARFAAGFAHVFPETDAYRLGPLEVRRVYPPQGGWRIVGAGVDGEGLRGLEGVMALAPSLRIDLTERMAGAIRAEGAFDEMPQIVPPAPPIVAERLAQMAEARLGRPCAGCFRIGLPVGSVEGYRVEDLDPPAFALSHYRIEK